MSNQDVKNLLSCWVVTDGKAGMETQCLGLAEALGFHDGLNAQVKRISLGKPWRWLPPLAVVNPLSRLTAKGEFLAPPWPDILIASGRKAVAPALAVRRESAGKTFTIQIQNPAVDPRRFDVVVAPAHDGLEGDNVLSTLGALGRVTPERLAQEARHFAARYSHLPHPRIAVLIGGNNRAYRLTAAAMTRFSEALAALARRDGAGLMVTPSRRTGARNEAVLRAALVKVPAEIWDGEGSNPYFGLLGLADHIVVTADSVNMISEAASSGKPVYILALEGGSKKFTRFHQTMIERGIARPFDGKLAEWRYTPLNETARVADLIRERLAKRGFPLPSK